MIQRWWHERKILLENININGKSGNLKRPMYAGNNTFISDDAILNGKIVIGDNCMIGNGAVIRGNVIIENNVRIGYGTEIKESIIREKTTIGPLCYIGDSLIEKEVYMGALVRTSNHRLDKEIIKSWNGEIFEATGLEKLGAWVKEKTVLGIGVVILPGRIVPENSIFEPHIIITKNYVPGHYRLEQNIVKVN
jgi:bifunctional UDP-N-acetylglucosamine pyrophosphorylase/glucosamine-1-phosphate N-acetyltransferase